jgi:type III secretion system FlhB-like substrate exporter
MMLPDMFNRGLAIGAITELNVTENVLADFDSVWKGYKREAGKSGGWIDVHENAKGYEEYKENHAVAQALAAEGRRVKQLPIHNRKGWKNPDYLIDGELWELETPTEMTRSAVGNAIRDGRRQAPNIIIHIKGNIADEDLRRAVKGQVVLKESSRPVHKLLVVKGTSMESWTADQIRAWK